jgi:hypothetical protein
MVHNSLQVGARQSFRAVPTAFKADDVTVSPLSHNTSSAIGSSWDSIEALPRNGESLVPNSVVFMPHYMYI